MHHVARIAGIVVVLWSCAPIARGQDDPRAGAAPSSPSGANPGSEYLREQPPAFGFPPGERGWLAPPPSAPQVPAPNGWGHQFPFVEFRHGDPNDVGRNVGWGEPLEGTSWLNRPWHVGWLVGALRGDDLVRGQVGQHTGLFGGYRVGWDFDHFWGTEARVAFANLELFDSQNPARPRTSRDTMYDLHLLYYPWGDARWRPYFSAGLGWAEFRFEDDQRRSFKDTTIQIPFGVGLKYYWRNWLALRIDVLDNLAFSSEHVDTMHNLSCTCGVEVHFGGSRRSYFPWNPGAQLW